MVESDGDGMCLFYDFMKLVALDSESSGRRRRKRALDNDVEDEFMMAMMFDESDNSNNDKKFENRMRKEMLDLKRKRFNMDKKRTYIAAYSDLTLRSTTLISSYLKLDTKKCEILDSYELEPNDAKRWRMNDIENLIRENEEERLGLNLELKLLTENHERNINNTNSNSNTEEGSTVSSISVDHII
jgi:hypothetical protein